MKIVLCILALVSASALAGTADYYPDIRATAGTQGFGGEVSETLIPSYLNLSVQGNYLSAGHNFNQDDTEYRGHARLFTAGLLLNVHPFGNGFRLTAGAYDNENKLTAKNTQTVTDNGIPVATNVQVKATFNRFAPYAGLGWVWGQRFTASLDAGVMFQGKAKTSFTVDCTFIGCQSLAQKEEQDVRAEADDYKFYPVIRLGLGF
jgi:hypothetical protein